MTEEVKFRAIPNRLPTDPGFRADESALRIELQDANARIASLAAENARLRWAIMGMLRWQWKFYAELYRAVPTLTVNDGIVALQEAMNHEECE